MGVNLDTAARYLCQKSGWTLSNLELQKLLYLSQVEYAGITGGNSLVQDTFEAWDYGPVIPILYRRLKMYGAQSVRDIFYSAKTIKKNTESIEALDKVWDEFGHADSGELIELTHWDYGAWSKLYAPGIKSIRISIGDIFEEYKNRELYSDEWREVTA